MIGFIFLVFEVKNYFFFMIIIMSMSVVCKMLWLFELGGMEEVKFSGIVVVCSVVSGF